MTKKAIATPCRHEHTTKDKKFQSILKGVYQKNMNSVPFYNSSNLNMDLNNTIVTASLNIPSPNTMEYNLGNFLEDMAYYDAMVSILQKHAPSNRISHNESYLIMVISLASLTRSYLIKYKRYWVDWPIIIVRQQQQRMQMFLQPQTLRHMRDFWQMLFF